MSESSELTISQRDLADPQLYRLNQRFQILEGQVDKVTTSVKNSSGSTSSTASDNGVSIDGSPVEY